MDKQRSVREIAERITKHAEFRDPTAAYILTFDEAVRLARFAVEMAEAATEQLDCDYDAWCTAKEVGRIAREGGW